MNILTTFLQSIRIERISLLLGITIIGLFTSNAFSNAGYLSSGPKQLRFSDERTPIDRSKLVNATKGESAIGKYHFSPPQTIEKSISVGSNVAVQTSSEKTNKLSSSDVVMYISDDITDKERTRGDVNVKIEPILRQYNKS